MRIRRTIFCNKSKYFALVKLYCLTWSQIFCNYDNRLVSIQSTFSLTHKNTNYSFRNILDICRTSTHIFIFHSGKHCSKVICSRCNRIFCINAFRLDDIIDRFQIAFILKHHLMHFKDSCAGFSNFLNCFLIKLFKLPDRLFLRLIHACFLGFDIINLPASYTLIFLFHYRDFSDSNTGKYHFTL